MPNLDRAAFRALALTLGVSERALAALAKASPPKSDPLTEADHDRLASIARREAGAVRGALSTIDRLPTASPYAKAISEHEAAAIVARRVSRSFDKLRLEVTR